MAGCRVWSKLDTMRAVGQGRQIDPASDTGRLARAQYAHNTIDKRVTVRAQYKCPARWGPGERKRERE